MHLYSCAFNVSAFYTSFIVSKLKIDYTDLITKDLLERKL